jgi:hypothetical protein
VGAPGADLSMVAVGAACAAGRNIHEFFLLGLDIHIMRAMLTA